MPRLVQVQNDYSDRSFSIVGVTHVDAATAQEFVRARELNFPVLADAGDVRDAYGVDLVWGSAFFLVGPDGTVVEQGLEDGLARLAAELGPAE